MDSRLSAHPALTGTAAAAAAGLFAWWLDGYVAGGCGAPGAKFSCLGEGLVALFVGPFVIVLLGWTFLRALRVRRPFLTTLLAMGLTLLLGYPASIVDSVVRSAVAGDTSTPAAVGVLTAVLAVGSATALATWLLSGAARGRSVLMTSVTVLAVVLAAGVVEESEQDRRTRADLERARVVLLAPPPGWTIDSLYVTDGGSVNLTTHPHDSDPYGDRSVNVALERHATGRAAEQCEYYACRPLDGDLVAVGGDATGARVVARRDETDVVVHSYRDGVVARSAVLEVARGLREVEPDALVALEDSAYGGWLPRLG